MENYYKNYLTHSEDELCHYGVLGMKWGVRKADAYDSIYYKAKYNKKRVDLRKQKDSGEISKGKYASKRMASVLNRYLLDPYRQVGRGVGRRFRGAGRLVSGKTWNKHNNQEYEGNRQRAYDGFGFSDKTKKRLDEIVDMSINDITVAGQQGTLTGRANVNATIYDLLDREQLTFRK